MPELDWSRTASQAGEGLGFSAATAGDVNGDGYSDLVFGAPWHDDGWENRGRAYVHYGSANGLSTFENWSESGIGTGALLGYAVACVGDVNGDGYDDVLVGAPSTDHIQHDDGEIRLYLGSASGLSSTPWWEADGPQAGELFGSAVTAAGDVNGDGYDDFAVGSWAHDSNGNLSSGRVQLFYGSATAPNWVWNYDGAHQSALLGTYLASADWNGDGYGDLVVTSFNPAFEAEHRVFFGGPGGLPLTPDYMFIAGDAFTGTSVASAGDVNGDGYEDLVVGNPAWGDANAEAGKLSIRYGSADLSLEFWQLTGTEAGQQLGFRTACAGDVNGDGYADFLARSKESDGSGTVHLFYGTADGPTSGPIWEVEGGAGDDLGWGLAPAGDVNGDGFSDFCVASPYLDNGSTDGRVDVYHGGGDSPGSLPLWSISGSQTNARFGIAVAAGDFDGDGADDAVVGSSAWDGPGADAGLVSVYYGSEPGFEPDWAVQGEAAGMQLGSAIATALDVDGDGYEDLLVGAPGANGGAGQARLYLGSETGLSPAYSWTAEGQSGDDAFGAAVASAGDLNGDGYADVIIGAPGAGGSLRPGRVEVYLGSSLGLTEFPVWSHDGGQPGARFGFSVACAGDVDADGFSDLIIGAPDYDDPEVDEGATFLFFGTSTGVSAEAPWTTQLDEAGAEHGFAVASAGDVDADGYSDVIIGSPRYGSSDAGRVDVYRGAAAESEYELEMQWTAGHPSAYFGWSVGSADFDLDGRSDVVLGAPGVDNGQVDEGQVWAYRAPFDSPGHWFANDGNVDFASHGSTVVTGDLNADGFPDILSGAPGQIGAVSSAGHAFIWPGGGIWQQTGGPSLLGGPARRLHARRTDHSSPVALLGAVDASEIAVEGHLRSPLGRDEVRLEVEMKSLGVPFDGSSTWLSPPIDTGAPVEGEGSVVLASVDALGLGVGAHRWRARVVSDHPFWKRSPWFGPARNAATESDFRRRPAVASAGDEFENLSARSLDVSPSPFAASTTFRFQTPTAGRAKLRVVDASGRLVDVVTDRAMDAGTHEIDWSPEARGERLSNGVYYAILEHSGGRSRTKLVVLR